MKTQIDRRNEEDIMNSIAHVIQTQPNRLTYSRKYAVWQQMSACFATICVSQCFWSRVTISGAFLWPGPEYITNNGGTHKSLNKRTKPKQVFLTYAYIHTKLTAVKITTCVSLN